ncbi:MAG: hypothetical protein ACHBN1_37010 [Heteroscytonema crispum UTEX LB 1556]
MVSGNKDNNVFDAQQTAKPAGTSQSKHCKIIKKAHLGCWRSP